MPTDQWLPFERPLAELEEEISNLRTLSRREGIDASDELAELEKKAADRRRKIFTHLTPLEKVQLARHPRRPYTLDYVQRLLTDFTELHGDRLFADDPAIVAGFGRFRGRNVCLVGHQKGRDTREKIRRNFGCPRPEGYRKALRVMKLAARSGRPIVSLVDTMGADPGIGAEERGQAWAISENLYAMSQLAVPIVVVVIGEGGSGGALAIAVGDRVLMLEYSTYSVITPEGCASILWKSATHAADAAAALRVTAEEVVGLQVADGVVPEPPGGAHRDYDGAAELVGDAVEEALAELDRVPAPDLLAARRAKFQRMGAYSEG